MNKKLYTHILLFFAVFLFLPDVKAVTVPNSSVSTFSPEQRSSRTESLWIRPYSSFETIELENKNKVHNTGYGAYIGYDTNVIELNPDWDSVFTFHTGYNGSKQVYNGRNIIQNGGQIGVSGVFFRKNFYIGFLTNIGAVNAEAHSSLENINFSMLNSTSAVKTGYNFEFLNKRLMVQPSFLCAYLFVNTFDYLNGNNVMVKSEPVHSIQLIPGIKFTGNFDNGWEPFLGVQAVWNLMNESNFSANDVSVGDISVKPYVQYGIGVQKTDGEKYSGYVQATLRNGGRNGIVLSLGLRRYL
ncbi:MAG: autotransporter outer membrane beta-barrel domain-containing protein [Candidatus Avigastranaerophilus sp.]